jgi:hypothetical protein
MAAHSPLARNPLSVVGAWLTTIAAFAFIGYYVAESLGWLESPYSGLFGFVLVPILFVVGLLLIPLGIWREGRRRRRGREPWSWPPIDLARPRTRQVLLVVLVLTLVNLTIVGVAGLGAVHYMETDQFCGQVCHEPMTPEFTAHAFAPHANVPCVGCHVGPGAAGTVRAKMNGARQMALYMLGRYSRPIPTPAHNMPPAADTCVRCHTPGHPVQDTTFVKHEYADDETNTETVTRLLMLTGNIHWHARPDTVVEFIATDEKRETIPYVRVTARDGQVTEYFAPDVTERPAGTLRRMDCLDCHSRPAHTMAPSAELAVDQAIASGAIDRTLPFVRREAVAALKAEYPTQDAAHEGIRQRLTDFYKSTPAPEPQVSRSIAAIQALYARNVFPSMKITWGTYLSQRGHVETTGCFRCHDDEHKTKAGTAIRQECEVCHREQ